MERREFIKQTCSLCLAMSAGFLVSSISSCSSIPIYKTEAENNRVIIPLSLFTTSALLIVRPKRYEYGIAVRKESTQTYSALLLRCTHADNQLVSTGNGYLCNLHGSKFDLSGAVIKGPAELPLKRITTEIISDSLIILLA